MSSIGISEVYSILKKISKGCCLNEQFLRVEDKEEFVVKLTTSSTGGGGHQME